MLLTPLLQPDATAGDGRKRAALSDEPDDSEPIESEQMPEQPDAAAGDERDHLAAVAGDKLSDEPDDTEPIESEQKPEQPDAAAGDGRHALPSTTADGRNDGLHGSAGANGVGDESHNEPDDFEATNSDNKPKQMPDKNPKQSGPSDLGARPQDTDSVNNLAEKSVGRPLVPSAGTAIQMLRDKSHAFADSAAASSMASEAVSFSRAVDEFAAGKHRTKKVMDSGLSKTGRLLCDAACRAPPSEAALAAVAIKITGESFEFLLSSEERGSRRCALCRRWLERLRAAVSGPEPTLPVHRIRQRQEKLSDKRQALFGVALAAPLALLTSAASVQVFPSTFGPWIAGISAVFWIVVSCGLVMDMFGKTKLEFQLASCLSRLGVMGVTVLFCLFVFGAFFPSATVGMWAVVALAVALHVWLCIASRKQGDEEEASLETASKCCTGCTCRCRLEV